MDGGATGACDNGHGFRVVSNDGIAPGLHRLVVEAPRIARAYKPGQFVVVRADLGGERIPLTIADDDREAGTITLIIQAVGESTKRIVSVPAGGGLRDVAGPLGQPTEMRTGAGWSAWAAGWAPPCSTRSPRRWPTPATS